MRLSPPLPESSISPNFFRAATVSKPPLLFSEYPHHLTATLTGTGLRLAFSKRTRARCQRRQVDRLPGSWGFGPFSRSCRDFITLQENWQRTGPPAAVAEVPLALVRLLRHNCRQHPAEDGGHAYAKTEPGPRVADDGVSVARGGRADGDSVGYGEPGGPALSRRPPGPLSLAAVAQLAEHRAVNSGGASSNLVGSALNRSSIFAA